MSYVSTHDKMSKGPHFMAAHVSPAEVTTTVNVNVKVPG
jgi:hypothetical protein